MGAKPVAGAFDLNDDGMVEQAVEQRGGNDGIAEGLAPFGKAAVAGEDHGAFFIASVHQLEEEVGTAVGDGQIADLVDDQVRCAVVKTQLFDQPALALRPGEGFDQFGEGAAIDAFPGLDRGDAERGREMALAGACWLFCRSA